MIYLFDSFEIFINIFQGFLIAYFVQTYISKGSPKFFKSVGVGLGILMSVAICVFNKITIFENYYTIIYCLMIYIYARLFYKTNFGQRIFASVYPMLIIFATTASISSAFSVVFNESIECLSTSYSIERVIIVCSIQFLSAYLILVSLKLFNKIGLQNLGISEWGLILLIFSVSIGILALLMSICFENINNHIRMYISICMILLLIINVSAFYFIIVISKKNYKIKQDEILLLENRFYLQLKNSSKNEYDIVKKIRHDTKGNYSVLSEMIKKGETEKALNYINTVNEELEKKEIYIYTKNDVLNSIVNSKFTEAKSYNIDVMCDSVDNIVGIEDYDLLRLLSNLLDNAITATKKNKVIKKQINLSITYDSSAYCFSLKNSVDFDVLKINPELKTNKKNKELHGYGIKIIQDIVSKYHGNLDFYMDEENNFCSLVIAKVGGVK